MMSSPVTLYPVAPSAPESTGAPSYKFPTVDQTEAFPYLTAAQIARFREVGRARKVELGEILFEPGLTNAPFWVLLSGSLDIVLSDGTSGEHAIVTFHAGAFTGEMTTISNRAGMARGRISEAGEFIELNRQQLHDLLARDAELNEILMRAFILRRILLLSSGYGNVILMGSRHSPETLRLREFLSRNAHPHTYIDLDTDKGSQAMLDRFSVKVEEIPVVICNGKTVLRNPSTHELARCLGFNPSIEPTEVHDVVIVGAGPAGLAAAVYAASEGLDVLVIETNAPGGQAGTSSRIENYLGFPMGVSGQELTNRAAAQAQKFGAKMIIASSVARLNCDQRPYQVHMDDGRAIPAKTIVIASGAQYNKPRIGNLVNFEGLGIYYGATFLESQLCGHEEVIVIGGGNSAGQAAVFLSETASKVHVLVRANRLSETMSRYLILRIEKNPKIDVHYCTEIVALEGANHLESVTWQEQSGATWSHPIRHVFIMAGASPRTDWLRGCLALDDKGFILTGRDLDPMPKEFRWTLDRPPQMLETSLPGVFAVGDVRANSVKRVASAVGEGAIAVSLVHRTLAEL
jgi:thioredoxin reductase (NADPH)